MLFYREAMISDVSSLQSLTYSFDRYLFSIPYILSTVLGAGDIIMNKTKSPFS